jgi:hypothetical protein
MTFGNGIFHFLLLHKVFMSLTNKMITFFYVFRYTLTIFALKTLFFTKFSVTTSLFKKYKLYYNIKFVNELQFLVLELVNNSEHSSHNTCLSTSSRSFASEADSQLAFNYHTKCNDPKGNYFIEDGRALRTQG